jgi:hypothetical protein
VLRVGTVLVDGAQAPRAARTINDAIILMPLGYLNLLSKSIVEQGPNRTMTDSLRAFYQNGQTISEVFSPRRRRTSVVESFSLAFSISR